SWETCSPAGRGGRRGAWCAGPPSACVRDRPPSRSQIGPWRHSRLVGSVAYRAGPVICLTLQPVVTGRNRSDRLSAGTQIDLLEKFAVLVVLGRPRGHDPPRVQDRDRISHVECDIDELLYHHDREALISESARGGEHLGADSRCQAGRGFV